MREKIILVCRYIVSTEVLIICDKLQGRASSGVRMLSSVDPGYWFFGVASVLQSET